MKINITVDVQDLFDCALENAESDGVGASLDLKEEIKNELINGILGRVSKDCISVVMKKANEKIDVALTEAVDSAINSINQKSVEFAENWLKGENIPVTDKWGKVKKYINILEEVQNAYAETLQMKVDDCGKFTKSSYDSLPLIDYVVNGAVKDQIMGRIPNFKKEIDVGIKKCLEEEAIKELASKINKITSK